MSKTTIPPLDLMFYLTETPKSPKHVGAVQVFKLPPKAPTNYLRDLVADFKKAEIVSPFNRKPFFPRFGLPEWREDRNIEIDYHVRHSALPKPGDTRQLMEVVQRLHSPMLDRDRPGWIFQLIEGLEGNRFAIYNKIHHAYIDGMSGAKRMYASLSTSPREERISPAWSSLPNIGGKPRSAKSTRDEGSALLRQATGMAEAARFLGDIGLRWLKLRDGEAQIPYAASPTRMNRPLERSTRATAVCSLPLDRVKAVGKAREGTVNEVILAVIGAALDDYLAEHGEGMERPLVALCPVSIRKQEDHTASTQVAAVHVRLGQPGAEINERLGQVLESSHAAKREVSGLSTEAMLDYSVFLFALMEILNRSKLDRLIAPSYNLIISNVPGPGEEKMYLRGSLLEASYPISTLLPGVNLNATVLSHGNSLDFGLMGDMHALPDIDIVASRMVARFEELAKSVLGKPKPARKTAKKSVSKAGARTKAKGKGRARSRRGASAR